jgi:hypothetical protein
MPVSIQTQLSGQIGGTFGEKVSPEVDSCAPYGGKKSGETDFFTPIRRRMNEKSGANRGNFRGKWGVRQKGRKPVFIGFWVG